MITNKIEPGALVRGTLNTSLYSTMLRDVNDGTIMLQKASEPTMHWLYKDELACVISVTERMVYVFAERVRGWAYPEDLDVMCAVKMPLLVK